MTVTHDEKEFLALLQPYSSDETRKARRNLSTIGFVVVSAWAFGVRFNDIRIIDADISKSSEAAAVGICLALLIYWAAMFLTSWLHDREIENERKIQGEAPAKVASLLLVPGRRSNNSLGKWGQADFLYHD